MTEKKEFDVFLCHNSDDKDIVKLIAEKLEKGGIKTWLDEREFVGGDDWIKKLYETLAQADVVFVFLGINGIGKWHCKEIEHSYSLYVDSGKKPRIVPILLFGATFDHLPSKLNYLKDIHSLKIDSLNDGEIRKLLQVFTKTQLRDREAEIESLVNYRVSYSHSNQSNIEENSKYFSWTIEELENLKKRHKQNTEILRQEYQDLNYNIKAKMAGMKTEKDGERLYKYTTEIDELKTKIKEIQKELDGKEQDLRYIKREIERKTISNKNLHNG